MQNQMISQKTHQMMSTEILTFDSALLSPTDQSFFSDDCLQTQHCSEITPQLAVCASDDWLQDFEDIRSFCDGLELSLNYEPELSLEAMDKEVDTQYQPKANEMIDYFDSSAFMSPLSIEPSSPETIDGHIVEQLDSNTETSAMSLLEEILSANSSDSETFESDPCFDSEMSLQFVTEVPKAVEITSEPKISPKRQTKRKAQTNNESTKSNKRVKASASEKRERKRNQNKSAANRYRQKKRAEMDEIEDQQNHFIEINNQLKAELQKLQMEFKVVYPLAKAAFASDPKKSLQLQMLDIRILSDNLLE